MGTNLPHTDLKCDLLSLICFFERMRKVDKYTGKHVSICLPVYLFTSPLITEN